MMVSIAKSSGFACATAFVMIAIVPDRQPHGVAVGAWPVSGAFSRNMVNLFEKDLPTTWSVEEGKLKNIKWTAELGNRTFGSPIVVNGKVFVATNNHQPRDPNVKGKKAVLMAFREADGKFLWQNPHDYPKDYEPGSVRGMPSTPAVDGKNLYYIASDHEVICADIDTGKISWRYDMTKELKVFLGYSSPYCVTPPLGAPLVVGDLVYVLTGNGINEEGKLVAPGAASFVAMNKKTGKLVWQSNLPGANIIEGQWSSPAFANVNGVPQVIFAGGDCVIYSFVPETGKLLWKCDCLPTRRKKGDRQLDNSIVATPVIVGDRLYIGLGNAAGGYSTTRSSYFLCLDITKKGDVSLKSYDAKAAENKGSALVWAFGGPIDPPPKKGRKAYFGPTMSTAAVHGGLVYIPEERGYLHCLDAATGQRFWEHDFKDTVWGSPYWVDGRLFVACESGEIVIFAGGRTAKVLATIDMDETIRTTPAAANGVFYVMTNSKLYAISSGR